MHFQKKLFYSLELSVTALIKLTDNKWNHHKASFKILTANFDIDLSIFIMSLFSTSSFIHTIGHSFGFAYNSLRCYTEMYGMRSTRKPSLALHPVFSLAKTAALFLWS